MAKAAVYSVPTNTDAEGAHDVYGHQSAPASPQAPCAIRPSTAPLLFLITTHFAGSRIITHLPKSS